MAPLEQFSSEYLRVSQFKANVASTDQAYRLPLIISVRPGFDQS